MPPGYHCSVYGPTRYGPGGIQPSVPYDNFPDLPVSPEPVGLTVDPKTIERWQCGLGESCFVCHPRSDA